MIATALVTPREVAKAEGRTAAHKIAGVIRDRIDAGKLQTGDTIPAERELAGVLGCARETVRDAYKLLTAAGLIVRRKGHPAKVRVPPPVRLMDESRYGDELARAKAGETVAGMTGFCADYGCGWSEYSVTPEFRREPASEPHAGALGVGAGDDVLYRRMLEHVRGVPVQIHESRLAASVVGEDSPVRDPRRYPWPGGTVAMLYSLGYEVRAVLSELDIARPPTAREATDLHIPETLTVSALTRRFLVGGDNPDEWVPIEVSTIILPGNGYRLRWTTTV